MSYYQKFILILIDQKEPSLNFNEVNFEDKQKLKIENILYFKKIINLMKMKN